MDHGIIAMIHINKHYTFRSQQSSGFCQSKQSLFSCLNVPKDIPQADDHVELQACLRDFGGFAFPELDLLLTLSTHRCAGFYGNNVTDSSSLGNYAGARCVPCTNIQQGAG